jgi:hypothetical protein
VSRPRSLPSRCVAALALLGCGLALGAGCGADSEGPSESDQVRAVVVRFGQASRARDYQTICDQLLSASLVRGVEAVGLPCESALQRGLADVRNPRLQVKEISVSSGRALVSVHSTADGQPPSDDAMQLVREQGQWRISSLVEPGSSTTTPSTATVAPPPTVTAPPTAATAPTTSTPTTLTGIAPEDDR